MPTTQTGFLPVRASHLLIGVVTVPLAYYAFAETYRYHVLRQRRAMHAAILHGSSTSQAIMESIKARFAALQCLLTGRYLNVTDEWREPGFWEFIIHQLLRPLSGRVWWNGGLPKDPSIAAASLPIEEPDYVLIRKHSWHSSSIPSASASSTLRVSSALNTTEIAESTRASSPSSDEGWEQLEASKTGPLATSSLPSTRQSTTPSTPIPENVRSSYSEMTVTWFGQSTSLVQMAGITFLTDPVFSTKPMDSFLAPSRLRPPPCSLTRLLELNVIDYVLISHNHFDHLDIQVVKSLSNSVTWLIPKGLHNFFVKQNQIDENKVIEMDWWEETKIDSPMGDIDIACTPAQHWSGRTPLDTNKSLWCGFVVKHPESGKSFFHAGDTGYSSELYKSIGRVHGPIDLGLIPIGSFSPRWMMSNVHTDPQGSVSIHRDLRIKKSIGVHWGTWIMSDERYDDPVKELEKAKFDKDIKKEEFVVLPVGRTFAF